MSLATFALMRIAILAVLLLTLVGGCIDLNQRGGGSHPRHPPPPEQTPAASGAANAAPRPTWPRNLIVGGGVTLAASWVVSTVMIAAGPSREETCPPSWDYCDPHHSYSGLLVVPIAGPALAWMDNNGKATPPLRGELAFYGTAATVNAAALVVVLIGVVGDAPDGTYWPRRVAGDWSVIPLASPSASGAAVSGSF